MILSYFRNSSKPDFNLRDAPRSKKRKSCSSLALGLTGQAGGSAAVVHGSGCGLHALRSEPGLTWLVGPNFLDVPMDPIRTCSRFPTLDFQEGAKYHMVSL